MYKKGIQLATMAFNAVERGAPFTFDYRIFLKNSDGKFLSAWHDVPLYHDEEAKIYNMICEIPRWSNAKMEMATKERLSPIKQDIKKGKLRYVDNVFPYHGYIWNYGALPQTWEDPSHVDTNTEAKGDNDPIDVCEIGSRTARRGEVVQVKILGILGMLDEGETDWKLIAINVNDPLASKLNDIADVEKEFPGLLEATRDWFRYYKVPTGKPESKFAFGGKFQDQKFAYNVIDQTNAFWRKLVGKSATNGESHAAGDADALDCHAVFADDVALRMSADDAASLVASKPPLAPAAPIDHCVERWHFVAK